MRASEKQKIAKLSELGNAGQSRIFVRNLPKIQTFQAPALKFCLKQILSERIYIWIWHSMNCYFRTKRWFEKSGNPVESLTSTSLPVKFTIVDMAEQDRRSYLLFVFLQLTWESLKCSFTYSDWTNKVIMRIGMGRKNWPSISNLQYWRCYDPSLSLLKPFNRTNLFQLILMASFWEHQSV